MLPISLEDILLQLPGVVFWQDTHSIFSGCNKAAFKLFGFKSAEQMIGSTPFDFRCKAVESADCYVKQDKQVVTTHSALSLLIIDTYSNEETEAHYVTKKPLIIDQILLGVIVHGTVITANSLLKFGTKISSIDIRYHQENLQRNAYVLTDRFNRIGISKRESECLFYLLRGKSVPEIAKILQLSKRTIESYINHIKTKMDCNTTTELCEKSITLGFLDIIPCSLTRIASVLNF